MKFGVSLRSTSKRTRHSWEFTFFVVGPGVGRDNGLQSTEYLGIWVSRAHVLALLPKPTDAESRRLAAPSANAPAAASASVTWAIATTRNLRTEKKDP